MSRDTIAAARKDLEQNITDKVAGLELSITDNVALLNERINRKMVAVEAEMGKQAHLLTSKLDQMMAQQETRFQAMQLQIQQQQQSATGPTTTGDHSVIGSVWNPRRANGRLNYLDDPSPGCQGLGPDTDDALLWTKGKWPQFIKPFEIDNTEMTRPAKNCQRPFKPPWEDNNVMKDAADMDILRKLGVLQTALRDEHSPYSSWPTRILRYLCHDFRCVHRFITNLNPTWGQAVEAILTVLLDNNTLSLPLSSLAVVTLKPSESFGSFASRLRDAVDNLAMDLRNTPAIQELTGDLIRRNAPSVWRELERAFVSNARAPVMVEHAKRLADEQDRILIAHRHQLATVTTPTTPLVEDPLTGEAEVNFIRSFESRTGVCFNCGQTGHWKRDCQSNPLPKYNPDKQYPSQSPSHPKARPQRDSRREPRQDRQRAGHRASRGRGRGRPTGGDRRHHRPRAYAVDDGLEDDNTGTDSADYESTDEEIDEASQHDVNDMVYLVREGHGVPHNLYAADINGCAGTVFFDYGSTNCWIEEPFATLADHTSHPTTLKGIGGFGAKISFDAVANITFYDGSSSSVKMEFTCGVVPTGTFPGSITLGKTVFHELQLQFLTDNKIKLQNLILTPVIPAIQAFANQPIEEEVNRMQASLKSVFPNVFLPQKGRITGAVNSKIEHRVEVDPDQQPVRLAPRRYSRPQLKALKTFCDTGLSQGVIERVGNSNPSPWSAQAHLVPKSQEDRQKFKRDRDDLSIIYRLCIDFRALNKATKKHAFPLPNIEDQIHKAAGHPFYFMFDLLHGFWHIPIAKASRSYTAFSTPFGQFQWLVMPFGLTNSPATFQALMNEVLEPLQEFLAGMMDDICLWADTIRQAHVPLHELFMRLSAYGLVINPGKSRWLLSEVKFLGFLISNVGYKIDPERVKAIMDRTPPTTVTELRSFLSAVSFVRQFIDHFTDIAAPLYELLGLAKGTSIRLTPKQLTAWKQLRAAMAKAPLLPTFDYRLPCVIDPDSSQLCAGACLMQPSISCSSTLQPVAYMSHKLSETQQRYSAQERELLAIILALRKWRHWVEGSDITVRTDHQSLSTVRTKAEIPPRVLRFSEEIEHYSPKIVYRKGKFQGLPDWLSRPPTPAPTHAFPGEEDDALDDDTLREADEEPEPITDPANLSFVDLLAIHEFLQARIDLPPGISIELVKTHFVLHRDKLFFVPLRHDDPPAHPAQLREVLAYADLKAECQLIHEERGHITAGILFRYAADRLWHPDLILAVQEAIRECQRCQLMQPPVRLGEPLSPIPPAQPLERWGVDFTLEQRPVRTAIDYATSWAIASFVTNQTSDTFIDLMNVISTTFGCPKEIITDNGGAFVDAGARQKAVTLGITLKNTTPVHPQTNGKVERFHRSLKMIYYRIRPTSITAEVCLATAIIIYNKTPNIAGFSPF